MSHVVVSEEAQAALHDLIAAEPLSDGLSGAERVLSALAKVVPCDVIGVAIADQEGWLIEEVTLPLPRATGAGARACDGPLLLGVRHWSRDPEHAPDLKARGLEDGVAIGFRAGRDHVVQVYLDRTATPFTESDLRMLRLLAPALDRIFRKQPTQRLPATITHSERRVLQLVATGMSNSEVAACVGVAPCTVRKHLENAYRKLGVSNRLAAVTRFEGAAPEDTDRAERIERFA